MPWKKIGKYLVAIIVGGGIGGGVPEAGETFQLSAELQQALAGLLTAIATLIALRANRP